jgi:hypothetical protein
MFTRSNLSLLFRWRWLPVGLSIGVGVVVLLGQFINNVALGEIVSTLIAVGALVAAFALLVGMTNLILFHTQRVVRRQPQTLYSLVILVTALVVFIVVLPSGGAGAASQWIMRYIYQPLEAAFLALLVFFIGTAVYRALRVRTWEMALFAITAVIVLVTSVPFLQVFSPLVPQVHEWVVNVPAVAGVRGVVLGVALGVIATGLRLLTGIDRPYSE